MMDQNSIITDLKRFGGKINAIKIVHMQTIPDVIDSDVTKVAPTAPTALVDLNALDIVDALDAPGAIKAPVMSVESIAAMVQAPFVVLRDNHGLIYDSATLAIKCDRSHIHKYFLSDLAKSGLVKCITCSSGNKFTTKARQYIEKVLEMPFAIPAKNLCVIKNAYEFANPVLKLSIVCVGVIGVSKVDLIEDYNVLILYRTTSMKKITDTIHDFLQKFTDRLNPRQIAAIANKPKLLTPFQRGQVYLKNPIIAPGADDTMEKCVMR